MASPDLVWSVEVEILGFRRWDPLIRLRLRRALAADSDVIGVRTLRPFVEGLALRSFAPSIVVEVIADSPGAAANRAETVVSRALAELGRGSDVRAHIVSTEGERP
jgi:hypothetical protein